MLVCALLPGKFEYPHDPHDPEHLDYPPHIVKGGALLLLLRRDGGAGGHCGGGEAHLLLAHDEEGHVVGHDGQHVYHVHGALHELPLLGSSGKPEQRTGSVSG